MSTDTDRATDRAISGAAEAMVSAVSPEAVNQTIRYTMWSVFMTSSALPADPEARAEIVALAEEAVAADGLVVRGPLRRVVSPGAGSVHGRLQRQRGLPARPPSEADRRSARRTRGRPQLASALGPDAAGRIDDRAEGPKKMQPLSAPAPTPLTQPSKAEQPAAPAEPGEEKPPAAPGEVVSLDAFRKK